MLPPLLKGAGVICKNVVYKAGELPICEAEDVVVAMGNEPLDELKRQGVVAKNRTIGSLRGQEKKLPSGAALFLSYSFGIRDVDYSLAIDVCGDVKLALRKLTTGSVKPPQLDFQWVPDLTAVVERLDGMIAAKSSGCVDAAIDLETTGLVAHDPKTWIVTFQISLDTKSSRVIRFDADFQPRKPVGEPTCREELIWVQINYILNHPRVSMKGANLKFDTGWIVEKWGIYCTNFKMDTLLVGSLLDENRSNSLKTHAHVYTVYGGYEGELYNEYDISRPQDVPPEILLPYCGYDTVVCLEVAEKMRHELINYRYPATMDGVGDIYDIPMLANFYMKILHPAGRAYEEVEQVGVVVDTDYYNKFKRELQESTKKNAGQALAMLPGRIKAKFKDNVDLSRAAMLGCFFFSKLGMNLKPIMFTPKPDKKTGLPKPSTAMEHFLKFEKNPVAAPFIKVVKEYKDISKTLSTYVVGFLSHLRYDNRFHASYALYRGAVEGDEKDAGAVTGRISIQDPALQTVPKKTKWAKPLRKAYTAPEGYLVCNIDFSQGELRIAADLADEPVMLKAYADNLDLHAVTGAGLAGIDFATFMTYKDNPDEALAKIYEEKRQSAKGANFGLVYGMGAEGYRDYAEIAYRHIMTLEEATTNRDRFFDTYKRLIPWHDKYKAFAKKYGYTHSPLGRVRHLPLLNSSDRLTASKELRRSVNSPVQSTLSDMSLWATAIIQQEGHSKKAPTVMMCHDALVFYLPEDNWEFYARTYRDIMENLPFEQVNWKPRVKFQCDVEVGKNWADLKKVKV